LEKQKKIFRLKRSEVEDALAECERRKLSQDKQLKMVKKKESEILKQRGELAQ